VSYQESVILEPAELTVTVVAQNEEKARLIAQGAIKTVRKIQFEVNDFDSRSNISKININAGIKPVVVAPSLEDLIPLSIEFGRNTRGLFDVTVRPYKALWGFGSDGVQVPSRERRKKTKDLVGYQQIIWDPASKTAYLPRKGMAIDLGGVAKGYAVQKAVETMMDAGAAGGLVAWGGEVAGFGQRQDGAPWQIGIQHPRSSGLIGVLTLQKGAVATSGDYQNYFETEQRFSHIINPHTGDAAPKCASVTVVGPRGTEADMLATAIFVAGPFDGLGLLQKFPGYRALILYEQKGRLCQKSSPGFPIKWSGEAPPAR
jgi:thiamine biosynthesis lipoprotein